MKLETAFTYLHGKTIEQAIEINRLRESAKEKRGANADIRNEMQLIINKAQDYCVELSKENKKHLSRIDILLKDNKVNEDKLRKIKTIVDHSNDDYCPISESFRWTINKILNE